MKLFKQGVDVSQSIIDRVNYYQQLLQDQKLLVIDNVDHVEHIAAYMAWQNHPGQLLVMNPFLPVNDQQYLLDSVRELGNVNDAVFFHTSGTTGRPKVIQHGRSQFEMFDSFSDNMYKFTESTKFLCVLPAVTSAFWHIVLPSFYRVGFELHLTARNQLIDDLQRTKFDATMFTPNIVDFIRNHGSSVNFDSFSGLAIGGAPVTDRHAEFLFSHGANTCINSYGTTETGSPLLARKITSNDQFYDHCNLTPLAAGVEFKLVDQELWVKSPSLCENFKSFSHDGEWRRTGDLWQQNQGLIKYVGRTDDVVKINGYTTNLLEIETWWESHQLLGECVAKVRSIGGNDYIELAHTVVIDASTKNNLKSQARNIFPECNVPAKFTLINTIPKTALGKKQRHLVTS